MLGPELRAQPSSRGSPSLRVPCSVLRASGQQPLGSFGRVCSHAAHATFDPRQLRRPAPDVIIAAPTILIFHSVPRILGNGRQLQRMPGVHRAAVVRVAGCEARLILREHHDGTAVN